MSRNTADWSGHFFLVSTFRRYVRVTWPPRVYFAVINRICINNDLVIHRQVKTSDIISRRFGDFMTPFSMLQMKIKLTNARSRVTTQSDLQSGGGYTNTLARIESAYVLVCIGINRIESVSKNLLPTSNCSLARIANIAIVMDITDIFLSFAVIRINYETLNITLQLLPPNSWHQHCVSCLL